MASFSLFALSGLVATAMVIALAFLWLLGQVSRGNARQAARSQISMPLRAHFLFNGETLADHDLPILAINDGVEQSVDTWADFRGWIGGRFGKLPDRLSNVTPDHLSHHASLNASDRATLTITRTGKTTRVILEDPNATDALSQHRAGQVEKDVQRYRAALDEAPCAVCLLDEKKRPVWQNELFSAFTDDEAEQLIHAATETLASDRVRLKSERHECDRHFELRRSTQGGCEALYVIDVSKVVQAERVRREFVQTLTKTFANLTTGLAVFDRHRQLALFNPALVDLTNLPAVFLSGRPSLNQFFDRLRDHKVLPEPKSYNGWRAQIASMIESASEGLYLEDWCLPSGLTYRVTGRPHPDGAIAFLFEDISDEITLTRRFRSQLELHMSIFDTLNEAVVVVGPSNLVVMCNASCSTLLSIEPGRSFAGMSGSDFIAACREALPDLQSWECISQAMNDRRSGNYDVSPASGKTYRCFVNPLPGQSVMVSLSSEPAAVLQDRPTAKA